MPEAMYCRLTGSVTSPCDPLLSRTFKNYTLFSRVVDLD
jgi:hypothetical protein